MTLPKRNRRKIVVQDIEYHWMVRNHFIEQNEIYFDLIFVLYIQSTCQNRRVEARFYGTGIEFIFSGMVQDIVITPRIVREVILRAEDEGWPKKLTFDYAEKTFPNAVKTLDIEDTKIAAAAHKWFVPYPGRKALEKRFHKSNGDLSVMSAQFNGIAEKQLEHWLLLLGIKPE